MTAMGVSIAFDDGPLVAAPTWTRIDNLAGVTVQRVSIKRGRAAEDEKTAVGTCTISGIDRVGVLDPTNTTGAYYGKLDPVKQVAFAIYNPMTAAWARRFTGKWDELTYEIDPSGKYATFELACVDDLEILTDAEVIPGGAGTTAPFESQGSAFFAAAQVNDRLLAALADVSTSVLGVTWPPALLDIFSGNVAVQDSIYSTRSPLLQVIQDACDAEFPMVPNFFVAVDGKLTFRGRYARFNPSTPGYGINHWKVGDQIAFEADGTTAVLSTGGAGSPLRFTRGKKNLINAAYCAPQGIKAEDVPGQLVTDPTSIAKFAVRSDSYEGLLTLQGDEGPPLDANAETKLFATYLVDNYKTPQNRPQSLVIRSKLPESQHAAANWDLLANIELSDLLTLTTTHPGGGGFPGVDFFVESIGEDHVPRNGELRGDDITMTLEVSPRAYFDTNPFSGDHAGS